MPGQLPGHQDGVEPAVLEGVRRLAPVVGDHHRVPLTREHPHGEPRGDHVVLGQQ